jgi:hypothetical protein
MLSSFKNKRVFTRKLTLAKQMLIINCQVLRKVNEIFGLTVALNMGQYFLDCPVQLFWLWTYITSKRDTFQIGLLGVHFVHLLLFLHFIAGALLVCFLSPIMIIFYFISIRGYIEKVSRFL